MRQTDVIQHHRFMPPLIRDGGITRSSADPDKPTRRV